MRSFLYGIICLNIRNVVFDSFTWFHRCPSVFALCQHFKNKQIFYLISSLSLCEKSSVGLGGFTLKLKNKTILSTQFSDYRVLIKKDFGSHYQSVNDKTHMSSYSHHLTQHYIFVWLLLIRLIDCLQGHADVGHQFVNVGSVPSRKTHEK